MRRGCILLLVLSACRDETQIELPPPWDPGQLTIVTITDAANHPTLPEPIILESGESLSLALPYEDPFQVHAESFDPSAPAPNGQPLAACDFTFVGDGNLLGDPKQRFRSQPIDAGATELSFEARPVDEPRAYELRHDRCRQAVPICTGLRLSFLPWPVPAALGAVVAIDDQRAMVGGQEDPPTRPEMLLGVLTGTVTNTIDPRLHQLFGQPSGLSGAPSEIWGYGGSYQPTGQNVWHLGLDGRPRPMPNFSREGATKNLSVGEDGSVFFSSSDSGLYELSESTVAERTDHPDPPRRLFAVSRARIATAGVGGSRPLRVFEGEGWRTEWERPNFDARDILDIAGDAQHLVASLSAKKVLRRNEAAHAWEQLAPPPDLFPNDVGMLATLGDDRIVLVGQGPGGIAVWQDGAWCVADSGTRFGYGALSRAPSGRVVYGVGYSDPEPDGRRSVIVKIELSE